MSPAQEARLLQRGCLAVIVAFVALCALAYFVDRSFLWAAAALVVFWEVVSRLKARRDKKLLIDAFEKAFDGFGQARPELSTELSYGFPSFTLISPTEDTMKTAQSGGYVHTFKLAVLELYGHCGSPSIPFDPELAVRATYQGWTPPSDIVQ